MIFGKNMWSGSTGVSLFDFDILFKKMGRRKPLNQKRLEIGFYAFFLKLTICSNLLIKKGKLF